ncbi:ParM/StbA family protein [Endozoicomonas sp. SM1973]|uniref:ParM/StbA family protein n=1 Tax=Spartinivicinus marinus TaxID=2994442 RepID=A0A853ICQ2_9GAMM|nr:ParM/StbA family protein [Spartinivicinus marinus]MCX4030201.1 ParM/StbA family protein [Spartinivicinus marinus]NYZ67844.1 ParM/StbA family protein [Spartinivicinus marinus]
MSKKIEIGADLGCAGKKFAWVENDKFVEFCRRSLVKAGKSTISFSRDTAATSLLAGGEEWTVTPGMTDSEDTRYESYPYSPHNLALTYISLLEAGFSDPELEIEICCSLPLNHYFTSTGINKVNIERKKKQFDIEVKNKSGNPLPKLVCKLITPEALAGFYDICFNVKGERVLTPSQPIGVADIGGRTTDSAIILPDMSLVPEATGTIPLGYLDIIDQLNQILNQRYNTGKIDTYLLEQVMQSDDKKVSFFMDQEPVDISEEIEQAHKYIANKIMREIDKKLLSANRSLGGICYFGGSAQAMRDELLKTQNSFIPEKPQGSNARGNKIILSLEQNNTKAKGEK